MQKNNLFKVRFSAHAIAVMAMLIALHVVLSRYLSINLTDFMRISFGFLPVALCGMLMGPIPAMITGGIADIIGYTLFPTGPYHFGFTLTAMLSGLIYGVVFNRKDVKLLHIILAKLLIDVLLNIGLNTLWIHQLYGKAIVALLPSRAYKNLFQFPVDVILLFSTIVLVKKIPSRYMPKMK